MEAEHEYSEFVVKVAQTYFPMLRSSTFMEVFKLTSSQVSIHLENINKVSDAVWIRNFLMLLYWARHYPSMRALGALFGLSKTQSCDIIHSMLDYYITLYPRYVNLSQVDVLNDFFLPWCVGIVDGTEILIQSWIPVCFVTIAS